MTDEQRAAALQVCGARTAGEWGVLDYDKRTLLYGSMKLGLMESPFRGPVEQEANAAYIALSTDPVSGWEAALRENERLHRIVAAALRAAKRVRERTDANDVQRLFFAQGAVAALTQLQELLGREASPNEHQQTVGELNADVAELAKLLEATDDG